MAQSPKPRSILESIGEEIVRIIAPVSACMLLVVILVSILNTDPSSSSQSVTTMATFAYSETDSDSSWDKFKGALLNSLVFVAVVTVVTFILVLLFYLRCTKFLKIYMGISAFVVLGFMGGEIALFLIEDFSIPIDSITFLLVLFNFAVVGVLAVFMSKMAILVTQGYLVFIGMLVAYWFTLLPEWTTWALLIAMALYDLAAVLLPVGPLRLLVELAISRDEDIPALVYEARPVVSDSGPMGGVVQRRVWRERRGVEGDLSKNLNSGNDSNPNTSSLGQNLNQSNSNFSAVLDSNPVGRGHNDRSLVIAEDGQISEGDAELSTPLIERRNNVQLHQLEDDPYSESMILEGIGLGSQVQSSWVLGTSSSTVF